MKRDKFFHVDSPSLHVHICGLSDLYNEIQTMESVAEPRLAIRAVRGHKATTKTAFLNELSAAFQFPGYFGENWDGVADCLADLKWLPAQAHVVVIANANQLLSMEPVSELKTMLSMFKHVAENKLKAKKPIPFHVVFHAGTDHAAALRQRLKEAGASIG